MAQTDFKGDEFEFPDEKGTKEEVKSDEIEIEIEDDTPARQGSKAH